MEFAARVSRRLHLGNLSDNYVSRSSGCEKKQEGGRKKRQSPAANLARDSSHCPLSAARSFKRHRQLDGKRTRWRREVNRGGGGGEEPGHLMVRNFAATIRRARNFLKWYRDTFDISRKNYSCAVSRRPWSDIKIWGEARITATRCCSELRAKSCGYRVSEISIVDNKIQNRNRKPLSWGDHV